MTARPSSTPLPASRRALLVARDRLQKLDPIERERRLAVAMAADIAEVVDECGGCSHDDLARLGWEQSDIRALGDIARAQLMAGDDAERLRGLHSDAA